MISSSPRRLAKDLSSHPVAGSLRAETPGQMSQPRKRAVFVDRDGVINQNRSEYVRSWDEFKFLDGSLDAIARLAATDFQVFVVTNQSAIGRSLVRRKIVDEIHERMVAHIEQAGGRVDKVLCCPHRPDENCDCRKPRAGLLLRACQEYHLDLSASYLIGDSLEDLMAASAVGCIAILVLTGRGREALTKLERHMDRVVVVEDLAAAVAWILDRKSGGTGSFAGELAMDKRGYGIRFARDDIKGFEKS